MFLLVLVHQLTKQRGASAGTHFVNSNLVRRTEQVEGFVDVSWCNLYELTTDLGRVKP